MRQSIDDLVTVSRRVAEVERRFNNSSGTARSGRLLAAAAGMMTAPTTTLASVFGTYGLAKILSEPATASSAAKWARAYEAWVRAPTAATVASLSRSTRNLSATIGDKLGAAISPEQILSGLGRSVPSYGGDDSRSQP